MSVPTQAALDRLRVTPLGPPLPPALDVSTDTRSLQPGQTFLALTGERFDGHDYIATALERGAAAVIVARAATVPAETPALVVADTLKAYMALAAIARDAWKGQIIAITGSTGKTTTKTFVAQILAAAGCAVLATPENENNEIGVAKFFLTAKPSDTTIGVVEMGCRHYRDIEPLVEIARPDVGILTNIGEAHLEIMGTRERLAETKWGLFSRGARAVINIDDVMSRRREFSLQGRPLFFGFGPLIPPPNATSVILRDRRTLGFFEGTRAHYERIDARVPGDYNLINAAAAAAGALALGLEPSEIAAAVAAIELPHGRYERHALGGMTVVYDAYNASMSGSLATLEAFVQEPADRRIVVFGSMAELGKDSPRMHERVGERVAQLGVDILLAGGDFAQELASGARHAGMPAERIVTYASNADAIAWLQRGAHPHDAVLLKGSRKYAMEQILKGLAGETAGTNGGSA